MTKEQVRAWFRKQPAVPRHPEDIVSEDEAVRYAVAFTDLTGSEAAAMLREQLPNRGTGGTRLSYQLGGVVEFCFEHAQGDDSLLILFAGTLGDEYAECWPYGS